MVLYLDPLVSEATALPADPYLLPLDIEIIVYT